MLWLKHFFTKGKSLKDGIKYFHTINGRMPNNLETIKMKNAFMEQTRGADVIQFPKDRITNPFKPRPEDVKKTDESPLTTLLDRQHKEIQSLDPNKQGLGFYREMGDIMKKHRREELELEYDTMFNKILDKAKRIEADPKVLLEAELGKKITGEETATQLLEFFKNRPKKASGGRAGYKHGLKVWGKSVEEQWPNLNEGQKDYIKEHFPDEVPENKASGGIAGQLHLNRPGYANGELAGWEFKTPDKEPRELTPEEIKEARKKWLEWLEKRKKVEDSLELSQALPEELPPYQGPDYETNIPKEAGKEIIRRIIGGGHENPPIGGGFAFDVPYGEGKPYDYGIQYQPGGSDFSTYYGIKEDGENVYGGGYQGENFGAGVRKEEGGDPTFGFEFKKKLKKKKKPIFGKAKGGRASYTKGGLAKILGV